MGLSCGASPHALTFRQISCLDRTRFDRGSWAYRVTGAKNYEKNQQKQSPAIVGFSVDERMLNYIFVRATSRTSTVRKICLQSVRIAEPRTRGCRRISRRNSDNQLPFVCCLPNGVRTLQARGSRLSTRIVQSARRRCDRRNRGDFSRASAWPAALLRRPPAPQRRCRRTRRRCCPNSGNA